MAKKNRRTIITKGILKDSLLELMQQKSISGITIRKICDLSDMSRSTFYLHYQDQYKLLKDIEKEVLEKTFENLNASDKDLLLYSIIMHGSLNALTGWINSRFRLPADEVAKIIYHAYGWVVTS